MHALCSDELRLVDHRLLWWLLAQQEKDAAGVATGLIKSGWRTRAAEDLAVTQVSIWEATARLRAAGIIQCERYQRDLVIRGEAFEL